MKQREIKFRAWHIVAEEMLYPEKQSDIFKWDEEGQRIKIMQFTGLTDKNGKDIYEADIVRILYSDWISKSDNDLRTIEQYKNDIAEIKVVQWSVNGFYVSNKIDGYSETIEYGTHGFIEVIGNIYENQELLK